MRSDNPEICKAAARMNRAHRNLASVFARMRFLLAPPVEQCLSMLAELESALGGERRAAAVVGPSIITLRSWKRRKTMSVPSRRLVWLVWCVVLHPERLRSVNDLVTWGRLRASE